MLEVICTSCGSQRKSERDWRCSCGGNFDYKPNVRFNRKLIVKEDRTVWRYRKFFPYIEKSEILSLGEGWTPIVPFEGRTYFKLEYMNPTLSFKDRGASVLVTSLRRAVEKTEEKKMVEDSSGNTGAAIAAYCAKACIPCQIFVPEGVSGAKARQIEAYGAEVRRIKGNRDDISRATEKAAEGAIYASHIWNPFFRDGIRSLGYEIVEQFDWNPPEKIVIPASAGTLMLGIMNGLTNLLESDVIDYLPEVMVVQSERISPIYHAFHGRHYDPPSKLDSIADALVSTKPVLQDLMLKGLKKFRGDCEVASENEIMDSTRELARRGFYVEPSSAVAYVGYKKWRKKGRIRKGEKTVVVMTGTGAKSWLSP